MSDGFQVLGKRYAHKRWRSNPENRKYSNKLALEWQHANKDKVMKSREKMRCIKKIDKNYYDNICENKTGYEKDFCEFEPI